MKRKRFLIAVFAMCITQLSAAPCATAANIDVKGHLHSERDTMVGSNSDYIADVSTTNVNTGKTSIHPTLTHSSSCEGDAYVYAGTTSPTTVTIIDEKSPVTFSTVNNISSNPSVLDVPGVGLLSQSLVDLLDFEEYFYKVPEAMENQYAGNQTTSCIVPFSSHSSTNEVTCDRCEGRGSVRVVVGSREIPCSACNGYGAYHEGTSANGNKTQIVNSGTQSFWDDTIGEYVALPSHSDGSFNADCTVGELTSAKVCKACGGTRVSYEDITEDQPCSRTMLAVTPCTRTHWGTGTYPTFSPRVTSWKTSKARVESKAGCRNTRLAVLVH